MQGKTPFSAMARMIPVSGSGTGLSPYHRIAAANVSMATGNRQAESAGWNRWVCGERLAEWQTVAK